MISSLSVLTEDAVETYLNHKIDKGNPAPLFDRFGNQLHNSAGEPLCLSYTHAAAYVAEVIRRSGLVNPQTTQDVAELSIPFWQPTDVLLFSKDGFVIIGMRSNVTKNAIGKCLTAAAGFPQAKGQPEDALSCGHRELPEETSLVWNNVAARDVDLGLITDRPLQKYNIKTLEGETLPGIVPTIVRTFALQANQDRNALLDQMRANHESAGFVVMNMDDFCKLADNPSAIISADFVPSSGLTIPIPNGSLLADLRRILEMPETAKISPSIEGYKLRSSIYVRVTGEDFMHNGSPETLIKTIKAAQILGIISFNPSAAISEPPKFADAKL